MPTRPQVTDPNSPHSDGTYSHLRMDSIFRGSGGAVAESQTEESYTANQTTTHTANPAPDHPTVEQYNSTAQNPATYNPHRPEMFDFDNVHEVLHIPLTAVNERGQDKETKYQLMPFTRERIYDKANSALNTTSVLLIMLLISTGLLVSSFFGFDTQNPWDIFTPHRQEVAQAKEVTSQFRQWAKLADIDTSSYDSRGIDTSNPSSNLATADADGDGLSNYDEYLLLSNPTNIQSCPNAKSDTQALIELINPGTCREVDWTNPSEVKNFISVFSANPAYRTWIDSFNPELAATTKVQITEESLASEAFLTPSTERINEFLATNELQKPSENSYADLIVEYAQQHSISVELILAVMQVADNATDRNLNPTSVGVNEQVSYSFESEESSIATTFQLLHYLTIRNVPQCTQLALHFGGDTNACTKIKSAYPTFED
jgi:hypothetical protein